jgi:hypothetical protein
MYRQFSRSYDGRSEQIRTQSETVKYGRESHGTRDSKMTALARASSNCKGQTRPLVRDSAPHQQTRNCLTVIKICFIPRQTGRLTDSRNMRLDSTEHTHRQYTESSTEIDQRMQ